MISLNPKIETEPRIKWVPQFKNTNYIPINNNYI